MSPSRTRISRITPPSRCWIVLFCPVVTNTPVAMTAPEIGAVLPQTPNPMIVAATITTPLIVAGRVLRGMSAYQGFATS